LFILAPFWGGLGLNRLLRGSAFADDAGYAVSYREYQHYNKNQNYDYD
jgi:hypothetical protein